MAQPLKQRASPGMAGNGGAPQRDFHFTDEDFAFIRKLVAERTGIALSDAKKDLVYGRLSRRLRQLGIRGFAAYCELLKQGDEQELVHFVNAITTNLTAFFREHHHFDYLADTVLTRWAEDAGKRRLRIWSAGCSSGEEAYSIAMVVREKFPHCAGRDIRILATDLDTNVVAHAKAGIYDAARVEGLPPERLRRWFRKGRGTNAGAVRVAPALQELITFKPLNLMQPWPMKGLFDVIFCRNVVIYFDKPTQRILFDRYANLLADDGHLFVGHSETLFKVTDRFQLIGKTVYRKRY
jgi:chemotaxis protein methyltransferase CheR